MIALPVRLALVACLLASPALPTLASSTAGSSASDAASSTVGSLSNSVRGSSNSSTNTVAEGPYRIIEVATIADRPEHVLLQLQAAADASVTGELQLELPMAAWRESGLKTGELVLARHRAYGVEFAHGQTRQPFFLALTDGWLQDMQTRPVSL